MAEFDSSVGAQMHLNDSKGELGCRRTGTRTPGRASCSPCPLARRCTIPRSCSSVTYVAARALLFYSRCMLVRLHFYAPSSSTRAASPSSSPPRHPPCVLGLASDIGLCPERSAVDNCDTRGRIYGAARCCRPCAVGSLLLCLRWPMRALRVSIPPRFPGLCSRGHRVPPAVCAEQRWITVRWASSGQAFRCL